MELLIQKHHVASLEQIQVLESLYFMEIRRRFDQIPDTEQRTNEWVYKPTETTFASWLECSDPNDGLFYIFGKAGSGKFTLMKYISEAEETQQRLKTWAGDKSLHIGSFYFWYQSSEMQRSLTAFFQSLLYQILCGTPELAPEVALGRLHYEVWDKKSLQTAFELILFLHPKDPDMPLVAVLDEVDRVNSHFARHIGNHWTHARDSPKKQGFDKYSEGGECNLLALAVQARLLKYVRAKVQSTPSLMQKKGRPLLDYALRPLRTTPIMMPYHIYREDASVEVKMVELLLHHGADPNQGVYLNDGETVWGLFLISMHSTREKALDILKRAWYGACLALVQAGAQRDYTFIHKRFRNKQTVSMVLHEVFGLEKTAALEAAMEAHTASRNSQGGSCRVM